MRYQKLTVDQFIENLKSKKYKGITGARRAVGKTEWGPKDKIRAQEATNKFFGEENVPKGGKGPVKKAEKRAEKKAALDNRKMLGPKVAAKKIAAKPAAKTPAKPAAKKAAKKAAGKAPPAHASADFGHDEPVVSIQAAHPPKAARRGGIQPSDFAHLIPAPSAPAMDGSNRSETREMAASNVIATFGVAGRVTSLSSKEVFVFHRAMDEYVANATAPTHEPGTERPQLAATRAPALPPSPQHYPQVMAAPGHVPHVAIPVPVQAPASVINDEAKHLAAQQAGEAAKMFVNKLVIPPPGAPVIPPLTNAQS